MAEPRETLTAATSSGDRRRSLVALRDTLAAAIDSCESMRDLAALAARFADVLAQLEAIPSAEAVSPADEIAKRRTSRRAGSTGSSRTKGAGVSVGGRR